MAALRDATRTIDDAFGRLGVVVWQNNGIPALQVIGHLHFHVAGTLPGGGAEFGSVPELSIDQTNGIARLLSRYVTQRPVVAVN